MTTFRGYPVEELVADLRTAHISRAIDDRERAWARGAGIGETVAGVLRTAVDEGITPAEAADRIAERRIEAARDRR